MYLIFGTNSKSLFRILFYNSFKVKKKKESDSVYISLTQQVNCFVVVFFVSADQALSLIES